jgi:hypothetical protein
MQSQQLGNFFLALSILYTFASSNNGVQARSCNKALFDDGLSEANTWRTFDNWECNVPPATIDGFAVAPVSNASVAGLNERLSGLFLFGGGRFPEQSLTANETWFFDVEEQLWSKLNTSNHPTARSNHTMVTLCNELVVLMGGNSLHNNRNLTDVWILNISTARWSQIIGDGKSDGQGPSPKSLYKTTARAVLQPMSPCNCRLSIIVPTEGNWSKLWELRCLHVQGRPVYQWFNVTLVGDSDSPNIGNGRLTTSAVSREVIYALTREALWSFSLSNPQWKKQGNLDSLITEYDKILTYMEEKRQLLLISIPYKTLAMSETLNQSENVTWRQGIIAGNSPVRLMNTYDIRDCICYSVDVVGSSIIAYGGSTPGCEQLTWILQETAVTCTPVWTWLRVPDAPLEPKRINQKPIVNYEKSIYVYGYSTFNGTNAQLWRSDVNQMKWWQLRRGSPPRLNGGIAVALPKQSTLVITGSAMPLKAETITRLETWVYSIRDNKWTNITTPPKLWYLRQHSLVAVNSTSVLLFGGHYSNKSLQNNTHAVNNIWLLSLKLDNLVNSHWELILLKEGSSKPNPRFAHSSIAWGTGMVIFGGQSNNTCFRDLWYFSARNITWKRWHTDSNDSSLDLSFDNTDCFSTAAAIGSHIVVLCGSNCWKKSTKHCSGNQEYQTWLYLPHLKTWRFISWISPLWGIQTATTFIYGNYVLMANSATSFQLKYMLLQCPNGLVSPDITDPETPCYPCPMGEYSSEDRKNCSRCPDGVTTSILGAKSVSDCNVCRQDQCEHGVCYIDHQQGSPHTVCHCYLGFSGSRCHLPTYYIVALAVVITLIVIGLGMWKVTRIIMRKRRHERELTRQVRELTNVWQIRSEELIFEDRVGAGAFGQVYRAEYRETTVAVKILRAPDDRQSLSEFEREIQFMQTVRHPHIVMFIGAGRMADNNQPFLVVEYMLRGSLRDVLDDKGIQLEVKRCLRFALDAAKGMSFLHSLKPPRIHNDLKSDNLLVSKNWVVKVSDFGSGLELHLARARTFRSRRHSITTPLLTDDGFEMQAVGAARWRAPEVSCKHFSNPSTMADVYR